MTATPATSGTERGSARDDLPQHAAEPARLAGTDRLTVVALVCGGAVSLETVAAHLLLSRLRSVGVTAIRCTVPGASRAADRWDRRRLRALDAVAAACALADLAFVVDVTTVDEVYRVAPMTDAVAVPGEHVDHPALLRAAGRSAHTVLLERGVCTRLVELRHAAERVQAAGTGEVMLAERGIRLSASAGGETIDLGAVALLGAMTGMPVLVGPLGTNVGAEDPTTAVAIGRAAVAVGAAGIILPLDAGLTSQIAEYPALTLSDFERVLGAVRSVADEVGRPLSVRSGAMPRDARALASAWRRELARVRSAIDATDDALLELVAQRIELARRAARTKRRLGQSIIDAPREAEVEGRWLAHAAALGLDVHSLRSLVRALIHAARAVQLDGDAS